MKQKDLSTLTDQELIIESKKKSVRPLTNAVFIGIMFGIVFYSVVKNSWGLLTLIPLFLAYKTLKDSKKNEELDQLLKERNLK